MTIEKKKEFNFQDYNNDYKKRNYMRATVLIPIEEKEIIEKINSVPSKSSYILELIRKDIKK